MTTDEQKDRIEWLLTSAGFSRLCPVKHEALVNDVDIWKGMLESGWGSAEFEIRAYPLSDRPGLVVDSEEE
jgi:hypothetical protein